MKSPLAIAALIIVQLLAMRSHGADEAAAGHAPMPSYGLWHSGRIGGGGYIIDGTIWAANPNIIHWKSDVGGIFRSDDAGRSWRMLHGSCPEKLTNVRSLLVDPRDDKKLIAAAGGQWDERAGIFVSDDAGASWTKTLSAQFDGNGPLRANGEVLARDPKNPDVVIAASSPTGLFKSADNGRTWTKLGMDDINVSDIKFDIRDSRRLWLCAFPDSAWMKVAGKSSQAKMQGGFFISEDGGASWSRITGRSPSELVQCPAQPDALYGIIGYACVATSPDNGRTWTNLAEGIKFDPQRAQNEGSCGSFQYHALGAGPDFILAASGNGDFYKLKAGERKWQPVVPAKVEQGDWYGRRIPGEGWDHFARSTSSIVVDPANPRHWVFSDWYALYQTFDEGATWTLTIDGVEMTCILCLAQDASSPSKVHMGMADNGYFRSDDGGSGYVHPSSGLTNICKSIDLSQRNPQRIYMAGNNEGQWISKKIFVSDDGGSSWRPTPMSGLPSGRHINTIAVQPDNPQALYATVSGATGENDGGVYQSSDGANTWKWAGEGLPKGARLFKEQLWRNGRALAIGDDGAKVLVGYANARLYFAKPGSNVWQEASGYDGGSPSEIAADRTAPGRFFAAAAKGIYMSADSGMSWKRILDKPARHIAADMLKPGRVAAGLEDYGGVILSLDGGATWSVPDKSLPNRDDNPVCFAGDRLIAGSGGNGMFWLPLDKLKP